TTNDRGEARVWDSSTGQQVIPALLHATVIRSASFSADSRLLATTALHDSSGGARVWDVSTGRTAITLSRFGSFRLYGALHASFSPDNRRLVVSAIDNAAQMFDLTTGEPVGPPLNHDNWVWHAVFSSDGKRVITASRDQTARVWDVASG